MRAGKQLKNMWAANCVDIDAICHITITCIDQVVIMLEKKNHLQDNVRICSLTIENVFSVLCHGTETGVLAPCAAPVCLNDTLLWVIASAKGGARTLGG